MCVCDSTFFLLLLATVGLRFLAYVAREEVVEAVGKIKSAETGLICTHMQTK